MALYFRSPFVSSLGNRALSEKNKKGAVRNSLLCAYRISWGLRHSQLKSTWKIGRRLAINQNIGKIERVGKHDVERVGLKNELSFVCKWLHRGARCTICTACIVVEQRRLTTIRFTVYQHTARAYCSYWGRQALVRESMAYPCMDFQKSTDINMDIHHFCMSVSNNYAYKLEYPHWYSSWDTHATIQVHSVMDIR